MMKKIHVLQIVPTLGYGGVAKFLLHYYDHMDKNQFCFDFITHGQPEDYHNQLIKEGSRVFYVKPPHELGTLNYLKQIKEIVKRNSFDIVHIHTGHHTGFLACYLKLHGIKHIICHAHTTKCMNPKHEKLMPLFRWMARHFTDQLFACGHDAGVYCFGTENFTIIPNGVDLSVFKRATVREVQSLKTKLGIPHDYRVIGCVAACVTPKNHNYLIKVFANYHKANPNSKLLLVGDGPLRSEIEKIVENYSLGTDVIFAGNQDDIPLFLSAFDVFALTSFHEGLPVVSAEAQALGLPCLFSENIDHSCDLGLGLIQFIPISENDVNVWSKCFSAFNPAVTESQIRKRFEETGYEINRGVFCLSSQYGSILK